MTDPAVKARAEEMLARVAKLPDVASVASPYAPHGAAQISHSGQVAFATVTMTQAGDELHDHPGQAVRQHREGGRRRRPAGRGRAARSPSRANQANVSSAGLGALAALVVLFVVFGSLLAALLPLMTAGSRARRRHGGDRPALPRDHMASFSSQLSLLIGLGVGVDYALFIVTRHRQGLQRGKTVEEAIVDAIDTSGRAVMFAGITVCIALLGMFALGVSFLYGVAIAASVVVAFTVLAALTLLPALLGFIGTRVLGRRARRSARRRAS